MGASWKRSGGGGYLNGKTGRINSTELEATKFEGGKNDEGYSKVSLVLDITQEGADDSVKQYLDLGFLPDGAKISKDKKSVVCEDDAPFRDDTEGIRFISSMVENGFPESDIAEGAGKRFDMIDGQRVVFMREKDRDQQIRVGKSRLLKKGKKNPTEDEAFEAGKREVTKGEHKGKKFDLDVLLVSKVLGADEGKGDKKTSSKTSAKKTSAKESEGDDETELDDDRKDEVLRALLTDAKDNTIPRKKIQGAITTWAVENDIEKPERDALAEALFDEDYLAEAADRGVCTYDTDEDKQPIVLVAKKKNKK